ncbi:MAG: TetR/AcrR family transcriptional regulator [Eubacteriales bacterium]
MKTQKAKDTHNAIVEAAKELFMERSVSKVTVSDITNRAGVAKGTFYVHFESKDDLVWHFIDHQLLPVFKWFEAFRILGHESKDIDDMVTYIVDYVRKNIKILRMIHKVRFINFLGRENMEKKYIYQMHGPICEWLKVGKESGKIDVLDPSLTAYYLIMGVHELIDKVVAGDLDFSMDDLEENLKFLLKKTVK